MCCLSQRTEFIEPDDKSRKRRTITRVAVFDVGIASASQTCSRKTKMNVLFINNDLSELRRSAMQLQSLDDQLRVITAQNEGEARDILTASAVDAIIHGISENDAEENTRINELVEMLEAVPVVNIVKKGVHDEINSGGPWRKTIHYNGEGLDYPRLIESMRLLVEKARSSASVTRSSFRKPEGSPMLTSLLKAKLVKKQPVDSIEIQEVTEPRRHVLMLDKSGRILYTSSKKGIPGFYSSFDQVSNLSFNELFSGEDYTRTTKALSEAAKGKICRYRVFASSTNSLSDSWNVLLRPISGSSRPDEFIEVEMETAADDFAHFEAGMNEKAVRQKQLFSKLFDKTVEGVTITDKDGTIMQINPAFSNITGYSREEVLGKNPRVLKSDRHDETFYEGMWQSLLKRGEWSGEIWNRRKDGEAYPEWLSIFAIKDVQGEITNYIGIFHDLTEIKQSREQIAYKTYHDSLTGLPNRSHFTSRLRNAIARATRNQSVLSLLMLDIDNFKQINETFGHPCGDELVQLVAKRLEECIRGDDTIARIGGDEFAIFCEDVENVNDVVVMAQRVMNRLKEPFILDGNEVYVSISMGVTLYPEDGLTDSELMKNADMALFKAKELGKKQFYFYTTNLHKSILRRMEIESNLRRALYNNEYVLHYQPKIDCNTGRVTGFESLIRWDSPKHGFVPPDEFISILEDIDYITEVGLWALETSCRDIQSLNNKGNRFGIAVNLSAKQFEDPWLVKNLAGVLERTDLPHDLLTLEITEGTIMNSVENAVNKMKALSELGIRISIDDFGTGYSSLSYLKRFPVNELKIDRSFVMDIPENQEDMAISRAIVSMAKSLDLNVVAEGVETEEQNDFLSTLGCGEMQGYLFSKPVPFKKIGPILKKRNG